MIDHPFNCQRWLESLPLRLEALELPSALENISQELQRHFEARVWFAEIYGQRWSPLAGSKPKPHILNLPQRYNLGNRIGIVVTTRGNLSASELDILISFLKNWLNVRCRPVLPD